jgi:hypothetical protein
VPWDEKSVGYKGAQEGRRGTIRGFWSALERKKDSGEILKVI